MIENKFLIEKIEDITMLIKNNYDYDKHNYSLFFGDSGILLFYAYYYRYVNNTESIYKTLVFTIEKILSKIENQVIDQNQVEYNFVDGLSGFYWCLQQLERLNLINISDIIDKESIASIILTQSINDLRSNKNFDFMYGGIGAAYPFMNNTDIDIFDAINNEIIKIPQVDESVAVWVQKMYNDDKKQWEKGQNLGIAHGYASVLLYLIKSNEIKPSKIILKLIDYTSIQLLKLRFSNNNISEFPSEALLDGTLGSPTAIWWSYSDIGIALALYKSGKVLGKTSHVDTALDILQKSLIRTAESDIPVLNVGMCQGSAGIIQLIQRFKFIFDEANVSNAYDYWTNDLLEKISKSTENLHFDYQDKTRTTSFDLFDGLAGVGLSLISQICGDYEWNKSFIIS